MAIIKNTAGQGLYVYAHDTAADAAKTGDAANITATISLDGAAAGATNDVNPTEIGGGVYWFSLTQAETNAGVLALIPVSATGDVVLDPVLVVTDDAAISSRLAPTDAGRTLDIAATGEASANVTMWTGVAVAAADANGNILAKLYPAQDNVTFNKVTINGGGLSPGDAALDITYGMGFGVRTATSWQIEGSAYPVPVVSASAVREEIDQNSTQLAIIVAATEAQTIADALLLAPAGAAAAGSAMDYLADTPANVWAYPTRTLTQSSTSTTDSTAAGSIARRRGDSWSISLTVGAITGYTSLWFTAKWDRDNTDAQAVLQIKLNASGLNDGLLYVNGAAATDDTLASITVSDASTGAIVIAVDETVTDDLPPAGIYYDVQALVSGTVSTLDSGTLTISADVTRAVA